MSRHDFDPETKICKVCRCSEKYLLNMPMKIHCLSPIPFEDENAEHVRQMCIRERAIYGGPRNMLDW